MRIWSRATGSSSLSKAFVINLMIRKQLNFHSFEEKKNNSESEPLSFFSSWTHLQCTNISRSNRSLDSCRKLITKQFYRDGLHSWYWRDAPHEPPPVLSILHLRWPVSQGPVCVFEHDRLCPQKHVAWPVGRRDRIKTGGSVELLFSCRWDARGDSRAPVTLEMPQAGNPRFGSHSSLSHRSLSLNCTTFRFPFNTNRKLEQCDVYVWAESALESG